MQSPMRSRIWAAIRRPSPMPAPCGMGDGLLIAAQILERMGDCILGLDHRVQLLQAVDREAVLRGQAPQGVEPPLVVEGVLRGGLELSPRLLARGGEIPLGRADLLERAGDEAAPYLRRGPQSFELIRDRIPHAA